MEENFRSQEPLVPDVYAEFLLGDGVDPVVPLDVLVGVRVELVELFGDVGADVAVPLLSKNGTVNIENIF